MNVTIPYTGWKDIINCIYNLGIGQIVSNNNTLDFLKEIEMIENNENLALSENGVKFFRTYFIIKDEDSANIIMKQCLMKHPIVTLMIQVFNGRGTITKEQVWNLLIHHNLISKKLKVDDLGSFYSILNKFNIAIYDKKNGKITIEQDMTIDQILPQYFVSPATPYSNIYNLRKIIRESKGNVYWIDKHFRKEGLEFLADSSSGERISKIVIISGSDNATESAKSDYQKIRQELASRNISLEWRICQDTNFLKIWHDRWIVADNFIYNIPPVLSVIRGQVSEFLKTNNKPDIEEFLTNSKILT